MKRNHSTFLNLNSHVAKSLALALCAGAAFVANSALAAEYTWNGGGGDANWGTSANWVNGANPDGSSSQAVIIHFAGSTNLSPNNNYGDYTQYQQILFDSGASSFTLGGSVAIKLYNWGGTAKVENNSSNLQTFSSNSSGTAIVFVGQGELDPTAGDLTINNNIYVDSPSAEVRVYGNNGHTLTLTGGLFNGSGTASLVNENNNLVILSGSNGYTGGTTTTSGTIQIGNGGTTGSLSTSSAITDNGSLVFNRSNNVSQGTDFSSTGISGTGSLVQAGTGTLLLTASNSLSGGVIIKSGTIAAGANGDQTVASLLGAGTVRIGDSATGANAGLTLNAYPTYSNNITIDSGAGTRTITSASSLGGQIPTISGTISLNNNLILAATGNGGLRANGVINDGTNSYSLTIVNSGTGTVRLNTANTFDGGVTINQGTLEQNTAAAALGTGTLTIGGTSGSNNATLMAAGSGYTATNAITVAAGNSGTNSIMSTAGSSYVYSGNLALNNNLFLNQNGSGSIQLSGTITGGSGTNTITNSGTSTGGVTLSGPIGNGTGTVAVVQNAASSTLTLSGLNTFSGGLTISSGTLAMSSNTALGGTSGTNGAVTINGGALKVSLGSTGMTNTHAITVGASGGTIAIALPTSGTPTWTLGSGLLSGSGTLTVSGAGTLGQAGSNTSVVVFASGALNAGFTGNVNISNGGIIEYASATGIPTSGTFTVNNLGMLSNNSVTIAQNVIVNNGGYLAFQNANTGVFSGGITLNGTATTRLQNWWNGTVINGTISGIMSGTGSLIVNAGSTTGGTLTLTNANTYTGTTTIAAGSFVQLGNAGATGSLSGSSSAAITDNGTLTTNRTNAVTQGTDFSSSGITGSGAFIQLGSGTTTLNVANTFTGSTTLTAGVLSVADTSYLGGAAANNGITFNGGTLQVTGTTMTSFGSHAQTYNASKTIGFDINNAANTFTTSATAFVSTDTLLKTGAGTLTLGAASNTITTLQLNQGTLDIGSNNLAINNAGGTTINDASTSGTTTINATGGGKIVLFSNNTTNGPDTGAANGATLIINASLTGSSSFENWTGTNNGTGVTVLNGTNDYTSDTIINGGVLSVSKFGNQGSTTSNLGQGTTIHMGVSNASTGTLLYTGTGETSNRVIDFTGTTVGGIIDASGSGLLKLTSNNTETGNGAKTLTLQGTGSGEFAGNLSGTNGALTVTKTGAGTWTLSGSNSYTGQTTVSAGTLNYTGTLSSAAQINVGVSGGANAVMNLQAGSSVTLSGATVHVEVGNGVGGTGQGFLYQSGGTLTKGTYTHLALGSANGTSFGYYNLSGGTANISELDMGGFNGTSTGVLDMSGGTLNISDWLIASRTGGSGGVGILNQTGGTINYTFATGAQAKSNWGSNGTAIFNIGGTLTAANADFDLNQSNNATNFGEINLLTGGTMQVHSIAPTANGTKLVNFNGGTLKANTATTTFITTNNTAANVYGNGGTIDNNGVAITIPVGLLAASGSGVSSVALSNSGSGYLGAPAVTFSGGSGTGAAGYAVVNSGTISSIVITNPGTGYTSAPTITLTGGGGSGAVLGTPTLVANTSGGMTFQGAGTTTLSASNSFTGATTIKAGTVSLGNANALAGGGNITFGGGTLQFSASNTADYSGRIVSSGSAISIDTNSQSVPFASSLASSNTGGLTKLGAGTLTLSGSNGFTGATLINAGTLGLGNANALAGGGNITFGGGTLQYSGSNTVDYSSRIVNSGSTSAVSIDTNGQSVTFATALATSNLGGLTKLGAGTLILSASNNYSGATTLSAGTLQFNGATAMSGSSVITMNGGTLSLNSDATNPTFAPSGSLLIGGASTINVGNISTGASQTVTLGNTAFNSGSTLNVTSSNGYILALSAVTTNGVSPTFSPAAGTTLNVGTITNNGGTYATFNFAGAGITNVTGAMTNSQANRSIAMTLNQTGAVTLSGNNNFRNNNNGSDNSNTYVSVNSGTTNFNNANAINTTSAGGSNFTNQNGVFTAGGISMYLYLNEANTATPTIDNTSGAPITLGGQYNTDIHGSFNFGGSSSLTLNSNAVTLTNATSPTITTSGTGTLTIAGAIAGGGTSGTNSGIIKAGAGTLALTNSNSYTGGTSLTAGTLSIGNAFALGTGTLTIGGTSGSSSAIATTNLGGSTIANNIVIAAGSSGTATTADTAGGGTTTTYSGTVTLNKAWTINNAGAAASGNTLSFTGAVTGTGNLTVDSSSSAFTNLTWLKSGSNSITGNVTVQNAGTLGTVNGALNSSNVVSIDSTSSLNTEGQSLTIAGLNGSGTVVVSNASSSVLTLGGTDAYSYSGVISNAGGLTMNGSGTQTLSGSNSYTGATTISNGTLQLGSGGTTGSLSTSSAITNNGNLTINRSNAVTQGTDFSGSAINGSGSFTQSGTGTTTLTANNGYTGATNVNAGTVIVSGSISATVSTFVAGGANLQVDGLVNGSSSTSLTGKLSGHGSIGAVTADSGTVAPGTATTTSILTTAALTLGNGGLAHLSMKIGGSTAGSGYDQVSISGASTLTLTNVNLDGSLINGYTPSTLATFDGTGAVTLNGDIFYLVIGAGNSQGAGVHFANAVIGGDGIYSGNFDTVNFGGQEFAISYHATAGSSFTGGNDIALMAVPEPATWAMLAGGLGMLVIFQRSRRRLAK